MTFDRRISSQDSLLSAQVDWAAHLADFMVTRFTKYGGWRDMKVEARVSKALSGVNVLLDGRGWTCAVEIKMSPSPVVEADFFLQSKEAEDLPELEDLDLDVLFGGGGKESFAYDIEARDSLDKTTMKLSLWLSKQVAPFTGR
jgi:hypothetical protein